MNWLDRLVKQSLVKWDKDGKSRRARARLLLVTLIIVAPMLAYTFYMVIDDGISLARDVIALDGLTSGMTLLLVFLLTSIVLLVPVALWVLLRQYCIARRDTGDRRSIFSSDDDEHHL